MPTHILILGDQLNRDVPPLQGAVPHETHVLMIESLELARSLPHHKQKLIHCLSAMRHFAAELAEAGFQVHYQQAAESFEAGIKAYLSVFPGVTLLMMQPNDAGYDLRLRQAARRYGGDITCVNNALWLSDAAWFAEWAKGRRTLRMEHFYREMRRRYGYLLDDDGAPIGGSWNYDAENRQTPEVGHRFPEALRFPPDAITQVVIRFVNHSFPDHFGDAEPFNWPVTRQEALRALHDFCANRLRYFGAYEDAMVAGEARLYHSLLSPLINTGLLHPKEVIETALAYYDDKRRKIPLNSIEGFVRQILGWREFIFQVYHLWRERLIDANALAHHAALPTLYWTGETEMNCLKQCLAQLKATGHNHHIQRLMVLGNFALLIGVNPQALLDWFTACYLDALEWVMVPNVLGMSQYADGGGFTSKPYAASGNYISRMSDYCQGCRYTPRRKTEADACPFNSLYWAFIDRHALRFRDNARMTMILKNWQAQPPTQRQALLDRAQEVRQILAAGKL
jgi:deoxyribodipyrimidine photolyase-related protein